VSHQRFVVPPQISEPVPEVGVAACQAQFTLSVLRLILYQPIVNFHRLLMVLDRLLELSALRA
jgi:hypothetical protein